MKEYNEINKVQIPDIGTLAIQVNNDGSIKVYEITKDTSIGEIIQIYKDSSVSFFRYKEDNKNSENLEENHNEKMVDTTPIVPPAPPVEETKVRMPLTEENVRKYYIDQNLNMGQVSEIMNITRANLQMLTSKYGIRKCVEENLLRKLIRKACYKN